MITAIHRLTMQSHMSYSSCSCFCLLDRAIQICVSCFRAVQIWCFVYNSLILTTGCSTWHLMAKNSLRIWELELLLSTKWNRPHKGQSKKLSPCAVRQVQKLASKNRHMSAASIALEQWFSKCGTRTTSGTWAFSSGTQRNLRIKYKSGRVSTKAIFF